MSTTTANTAARRRKWYRWGGLAAVVLIPLAFAGLFVGAIGGGDKALDDIPVAIVNQDTLQTTTAADGTVQNVFAGRQLVTELTGSTGFDWTITNQKDADAAASSAEIAADPVGLSVSTDNPVSDVGQVVATFFVPLGLWVGALAVFLVLRPVTRRALTSTARNGRLVASAIARASAVTVAQAVLLVALLHGALGVGWELLPATLCFSLLTAIAFTAFHYLLTIGLGRAGLVVSLFLLAVQITSTGGIYPIQLLSSPFQVVSPFLPLTYAVQGMQGILSGGDPGAVVMSALVLLGFGVGSTLLALLAIRRTRRASALGLVPRTV